MEIIIVREKFEENIVHGKIEELFLNVPKDSLTKLSQYCQMFLWIL